MPPPGGMPMPAFSQKALSKLVAETVPPDRGNAVVGTVDENGIAVVVHMTKGEHWAVEGTFARDWGGNMSTGAKVIFSW